MRYKTDERAARAWAKANGLRGAVGGWIYRDGKPYVQGYGQLAGRLRQRGLIAPDGDQWRIMVAPVRVELHGIPNHLGEQSFTLSWVEPDGTPKGQGFRTREPVDKVRERLEDTLARRAAECPTF